MLDEEKLRQFEQLVGLENEHFGIINSHFYIKLFTSARSSSDHFLTVLTTAAIFLGMTLTGFAALKALSSVDGAVRTFGMAWVSWSAKSDPLGLK